MSGKSIKTGTISANWVEKPARTGLFPWPSPVFGFSGMAVGLIFYFWHMAMGHISEFSGMGMGLNLEFWHMGMADN